MPTSQCLSVSLSLASSGLFQALGARARETALLLPVGTLPPRQVDRRGQGQLLSSEETGEGQPADVILVPSWCLLWYALLLAMQVIWKVLSCSRQGQYQSPREDAGGVFNGLSWRGTVAAICDEGLHPV